MDEDSMPSIILYHRFFGKVKWYNKNIKKEVEWNDRRGMDRTYRKKKVKILDFLKYPYYNINKRQYNNRKILLGGK